MVEQKRLCSGPCMPWCSCNTFTRVLAFCCVVYVVSCLVYLVLTKNVGTPLKDSLSEKQLEIKHASAKIRMQKYLQSLFCAVLVTFLFKKLNVLQ